MTTLCLLEIDSFLPGYQALEAGIVKLLYSVPHSYC